MLWPYINVLRTSSCTVILAATSVPPGCKLFVDPPETFWLKVYRDLGLCGRLRCMSDMNSLGVGLRHSA